MTQSVRRPGTIHTIHASAPIRICDNGGWTDTWFARRGRVCNIAVAPRVDVDLHVSPARDSRPRVVLDVVDFGDRYVVDPQQWGRHPLLEAAVRHAGLPADSDVTIAIRSGAPAGASTGTSAAVLVALTGALDAAAGRRSSPLEIAYTAHSIETGALGRQSGIQDHLSAALGGINDIVIDEYPRARVRRIEVPSAAAADLEARLVLVYLGASHDSSEVHEMVIRSLERAGPDHPPLEALRGAAQRGAEALERGELAAFGRAMQDNTRAQEDLHPRLIGTAARRVVEAARRNGALGWKVNGAGGEGGSVTLLSGGSGRARDGLAEAILKLESGLQIIPVRLDRDGLTVTSR